MNEFQQIREALGHLGAFRSGYTLAAVDRVEAALDEQEAAIESLEARVVAAEAERDALTAALRRIARMANAAIRDPLGTNMNDLIRIRDVALASASTTGASGALRDPDPGLGAGSVIDSQPSAKEPAPSTERPLGEGARRAVTEHGETLERLADEDGNTYTADFGQSATCPAPAEPPREERMEFVWLIERNEQENHSPVVWWAGKPAKWGEWTPDAWEARRFATKDEADEQIVRLSAHAYLPTAHAAEHGFATTSPAPAEPPEGPT